MNSIQRGLRVIRLFIIISMIAVLILDWLSRSTETFHIIQLIILIPLIPLLAITYKSRLSYSGIILLSIVTFIIVTLYALGLWDNFSMGSDEGMAIIMMIQFLILIVAGILAIFMGALRSEAKEFRNIL